MAELSHEIAPLREQVGVARQAGKVIGLVPTMGALHAGHLSLIRAARAECGFVVVSIFVNPAQFAPNEDYAAYPRTLETDVPAAAGAGADLIFAPSPVTMYPEGYATYVVQERLTETLCGHSRPTHFHGVCTVVAKLFNLVQPDIAYFGQKDYQQATVLRRMVVDLDFPIRMRVCPIVREADGLAMSSRNQYLTVDERAEAVCLSQALRQAEAMVADGERRANVILGAMRKIIMAAPQARIDYLALVDPDTLADVSRLDHRAVAAVAVRFPNVRLIDNTILVAPRNGPITQRAEA